MARTDLSPVLVSARQRERGELDAPPGMLARLDGARVALATVAEPARRPTRRPLAKD